MSSHFGIFDLAGFPKDTVGYYTAWWLAGANCTDASATVNVSPTDWTSPVPNGAPIQIIVTTCAASAGVYVNGVAVGSPQPVPAYGVVAWPNVLFSPGNLTAVAYNAAGAVVATRTVLTAGAPTQLQLSVASPYVGRNGSVIAADGQDAALVTVQLLDARGVVVPNADVNVTLSVTGPGVVIGVANGDPSDHGSPKATWRLTYHGLARVIVASSVAGGTGFIEVTATPTTGGIAPASVTLVAANP